MTKIILTHVNVVDEAMYLLYHFANTTDLTEKLEGYRSRFPHTEAIYHTKCEKLLSLYEEIVNNIATPKEKIDYYFKERTESMVTYASAALMYKRVKYDYTLDSLKAYAAQYSLSDRVKLYADMIWSEGAEQLPDSKLQTLDDLILFLENSPLRSEERWEMLTIFQHQEKYFSEAFEIIEEVVGLLNKHQEEIAAFEAEYLNTWQHYFEDDALLNVLTDRLKTNWELSHTGYVIIPSLFLFLTVMISLKSRFQQEDIIRLGVLFDDEITLTKPVITSDYIVKLGKLISDKSKLEILRFINNKPAYGKEIAEALNLKAPTISYHVNALLEMGLIKTSVESNKIYYSMNHESVENMLDDIKQFLLSHS